MGRETASGEGAPGGHGVNVHRGPEIRGPARSRGAREATPVRCRAWLQLACRAAAGCRTTRTCRFFDLRQCVALRALTSPTIVRPAEEIQRDGLRSDTARAEREVGGKARPMLSGAWPGVQRLAAPATAQTRVADAWLDADQSNCHSEKWLALDWRLTLAATHCARDSLVQVRRHAGTVRGRKLAQIHAAQALDFLRSPPGNQLEALKGDRKGQHSLRIRGQWRICFVWAKAGPTQLEIVGHH